MDGQRLADRVLGGQSVGKVVTVTRPIREPNIRYRIYFDLSGGRRTRTFNQRIKSPPSGFGRSWNQATSQGFTAHETSVKLRVSPVCQKEPEDAPRDN